MSFGHAAVAHNNAIAIRKVYRLHRFKCQCGRRTSTPPYVTGLRAEMCARCYRLHCEQEAEAMYQAQQDIDLELVLDKPFDLSRI